MALSINPHAVVQEVHLEPDAEKFRLPCSMSVSGPSQSMSTRNHEDYYFGLR